MADIFGQVIAGFLQFQYGRLKVCFKDGRGVIFHWILMNSGVAESYSSQDVCGGNRVDCILTSNAWVENCKV